MTLNRRQFLRLAGLVAGGATVSACSPLYHQFSGLPPELPADLHLPQLSPHQHLVLNRLTYGPTLDDRRRLAADGWKPWVEAQLAPHSIDDSGADWRIRAFNSLELAADGLVAWDREDVIGELRQATVIRRVYSTRQLYERMVEFWTDHFNISIHKGDCWFLKTVDDREVIRRHALGDFRQLLSASAHSPAMLIYLDNQSNQRSAPNENYARELMELHSLGVEGGYTQEDVMELARCLTGWTVKQRFWRGEFAFDPDLHDPGEKQVLGMRIEPAGQAETEQVLERLALHPSTARYLAGKLARRFVADQPAPGLVERAAGAFLAGQGSIGELLRVLLLEGLEQPGTKLKRPMDFIASGLRMLAADTDGGMPIQQLLAQMGQPLFGWPTPDGPPDRSTYWKSNLLPRWQFAIDLSRDQIPGSRIQLPQRWLEADPTAALDQLSYLLLGVPLDPVQRERLLDSLRAQAADRRTLLQLMVAGLLASPGFQYQ